ncbi:hypothetical protein WN093_08310 [Gammaproteobacteria bacterium AS21]
MISAKQRLQQLPFAIAGLAFGLASLGWNLEVVYPQSAIFQIATALLSTLIIIAVICKLYYSPLHFLQLIKDPSIGPLSPTIALVTMIASVNFSGDSAILIWALGVVLHTLLLVFFIITRYQNFQMAQVAPSWFIPFVATIVAVLTYPQTSHSSFAWLATNHVIIEQVFSQSVVIFAIASYFLILPLITYAVISKPLLTPDTRPALALFAAPANLCLLAYLLYFQTISTRFMILLLIIAVSMSIVSYVIVVQLIRRPFTPAMSSFTFPLVIGSPTMQATSDYFEQLQFNELYIKIFACLAQFQLYAATLVTLYVLYQYVRFLYRSVNS